MNYCFGVDIGGTTVKIGLFEETGTIVEKWEIPTNTLADGEAILPDIAFSLKTKIEERKLSEEDILVSSYAFAKLEFPCKKLLFGLVLIQMMLPSQIFIIPQYQMLAKMGATNSIFALVFPGLVSAFGTFFLRQAYLGIPNEIAEAAYLDGCNKWQTFVKVMLPLTGPSMAALAIFTAVFAYADLMWPLICNTDLNMMTLSAGLSTLNGQYTTNFPVLMAGSLLAMIPMVILYLIFQKQFIQGIAMTGGK